MHGKLNNRLERQLVEAKAGVLPTLGVAHAKGYRFSIGRHADGSTARFWLGHHRTEAQHRAQCYLHFWADITGAGHAQWTAAAIAKAKELGERKVAMVRRFHADLQQEVSGQQARIDRMFPEAAEGTPTSAEAEHDVVALPLAGGATLYEAIDAYLKSLSGKRVSQSHRWRAVQVLETTLKGLRADCALQAVDYRWLDALADHFKSRPLSRKGKVANRRPISPQTVKTTLQYLRQLFVWIDDASFGGWEAPRKLTKPFRVRLGDLMSPVELRRAGTIAQFDVSTLATLYRAAANPQRTIILAALATAGTQQELAVLEKSEFDLDRGELLHYRNKTHVEGRFRLPPELVALLREEFARHPGEPLAFYTRIGSPLVHYKDGRLASDAVRQMWDDLKARASVPKALPFKYLRKFVADWMTQRGGESIGQVALSHTRKSVLAKNYTSSRDFKRFNELQDEMYQELRDAGMFGVTVHAGPVGHPASMRLELPTADPASRASG